MSNKTNRTRPGSGVAGAPETPHALFEQPVDVEDDLHGLIPSRPKTRNSRLEVDVAERSESPTYSRSAASFSSAVRRVFVAWRPDRYDARFAAGKKCLL